jgi:hypothetical protein
MKKLSLGKRVLRILSDYIKKEKAIANIHVKFSF